MDLQIHCDLQDRNAGTSCQEMIGCDVGNSQGEEYQPKVPHHPPALGSTWPGPKPPQREPAQFAEDTHRVREELYRDTKNDERCNCTRNNLEKFWTNTCSLIFIVKMNCILNTAIFGKNVRTQEVRKCVYRWQVTAL